MSNAYAYSVQQVGKMLGISVQWIKSEIRSGRLRAFMLGDRYRVTQSALEEYEALSHREMMEASKNKTGVFAKAPPTPHFVNK